MSAESFLNKVGEGSSVHRNFDSLAQGQPYKIHSFSTYQYDTVDKKRTCVRVHIDDGYLFLSTRYDDCFDQLKSLKTGNLYIIYNGRKGNNNRLDIEFKEYDGNAAVTADDGVNQSSK